MGLHWTMASAQVDTNVRFWSPSELADTLKTTHVSQLVALREKEIIIIIRVHYQGTMNVTTKFHGNSF